MQERRFPTASNASHRDADTAGRLANDTEMMDEIKELHTAINPMETLFLVDSMTRDDASADPDSADSAGAARRAIRPIASSIWHRALP